jgi:ribosome-associated protein
VTKRGPRGDAQQRDTSRTAPGSPLARARQAADIAADKRAENVVILDLRGLTLVADYFVICTSTNRVQSRAIVEAMDDGLAQGHRSPRDGGEQAAWVLLDYGDVVVHVFTADARAFYRLERLWADAPVVAR